MSHSCRPSPIVTKPSGSQKTPLQPDTPSTVGIDTPTSPSQFTPTNDGPNTPMSDVWEEQEVDDELGRNVLLREEKLADQARTEELRATTHEASKRPNTVPIDMENADGSSRKHTITPLAQESTKRAKVETAPELDEKGLIILPFQSMISICMPPRNGNGPPTKDGFPYGPTEAYPNAMLLYWLDEQDKSYNETTKLFGQLFPQNKVVEEAIRKRHIRALQRLAKKYGVKSLAEIKGPVGKNTARRGKRRVEPIAAIEQNVAEVGPIDKAVKVTVHNNESTPSVVDEASQVKARAYTTKYVHEGWQYKAIEKTAIVVWKDLEGLNFKQIRERLDEQYDWSLGRATVEKHYYLTRPKLYGAFAGTNVEDGRAVQEDGPNEASEVKAIESFGGTVVKDASAPSNPALKASRHTSI